MIISRKRFEEEINKAVMKRQEEMYRERDLSDSFRYIRDDIDYLRKRINKLEDKVFEPVAVNELTIAALND